MLGRRGNRAVIRGPWHRKLPGAASSSGNLVVAAFLSGARHFEGTS